MSGLADSLTGAVGAILLANAVCTAYVFVRFAGRVVFDERRTAPSSTATPETVAVVVLAAALLVTFGLWPEPLASAAALAGAG
jgi:NADH:ubiquinone oxidoreductase subunit 2 (subunit N)